jgi:hypothetical protein
VADKRNRKIVAEVWELPRLAGVRTKPYSRHTSLTAARKSLEAARLKYPNAEPGYFVMLALRDGAFERVEE